MSMCLKMLNLYKVLLAVTLFVKHHFMLFSWQLTTASTSLYCLFKGFDPHVQYACWVMLCCCYCCLCLQEMSPHPPTHAPPCFMCTLFDFLNGLSRQPSNTEQILQPRYIWGFAGLTKLCQRLTSSTGKADGASSEFCIETLFSHLSAMWLTSSSFCSQLFCVFSSVTS